MMTTNSKPKMGTNPREKKPYCKVCHDSGKPEKVYTSHWVRSLPDRQGKTTVTCPTLLATECGYCKQRGHTSKFCEALEQKKRHDGHFAATASTKKVAKPVEKKKSTSTLTTHRPTQNLFEHLDEPDTEQPVFAPHTPDYPPPPSVREVVPRSPDCSPPPPTQPMPKGNWVQILAKEPVQINETDASSSFVPITKDNLSSWRENKQRKQTETATSSGNAWLCSRWQSGVFRMSNWADDLDDSEEED